MKHAWLTALVGVLLPLAPPVQKTAPPLRLHPDNPHYLMWRGRPALVITSGEHYGALLNLDFDYRKYLDTLARDRMNGTRVFVGSYVEGEGAFNIAGNTLNPAPGRFISPWARSTEPGYADGGNKFDLTRWDPAYFRRLKDLVSYAGQRGVIVEMNLFSPMYQDSMWEVSPLNARNNVNGVGRIGKDDVFTLDRHGGTLPVQEAMVRKVVSELRGFDNVYIEICNEPYATKLSPAWQRHITEVAAGTMRDWPAPLLISWNVANQSARVEDPHPDVSILNFHYATPPTTVAMNYDLDRVIGDNETGFRGTDDAAYRMEAWDFILAGGGLFNHLDYSFTVGHEDGSFAYPPTQPGGGGPTIRRQLRILREFMEGFDLPRMAPDRGLVRGGVPQLGTARALSAPGVAYAIYLRDLASTGPWSARWSGFLEVPETAEYTLHTFSNDGVRLWIDDVLLIDAWTDHGEQEDTAVRRLEAGTQYPVRVEYFYAGGQGAMKLWWSRPGVEAQPIPASALMKPDETGNGLQGDYFVGTNFDTAWFSRVDPQVNFAFGSDPPRSPGEAVKGAPLQVALPAGRWRAEWLDTKTGALAAREQFTHDGGERLLRPPAYQDDIALRIVRNAEAAPVAIRLERTR